jgi:hypothetical protein
VAKNATMHRTVKNIEAVELVNGMKQDEFLSFQIAHSGSFNASKS